MSARLLKAIFTIALWVPLWGAAEDIDLFVEATPPNTTENPNLIILIDNTSNWSANNQGWPNGEKQGRYELDAIITVVNSLAAPGADAALNLGLMFLTQGQGQTPSGAYVRSAVKPMTAANRTALVNLLTNINVNDPSENVPSSIGYDRAMFEVFKYFGGYTSVANANANVAGSPLSATQFGARRYSGNPDTKTDSAAFSDPATKNNYIPVIAANSTACSGKNYLIVIGNGWPSPAEKDGNTFTGETLLGNVGGATGQIYSTSSADRRYADEFARFLHQTDVSAAPGRQYVTTYTIDVFKNQQSQELTQLLKSMAAVGGGKYFEATSANAIYESLATIVSEIQSTNSVFASVSLPVSVNTQGTYLNQVFVGMFRPDRDALPRWHGNLKQYKLARINGSLKLADADDDSAVSASGSGFIAECARSYWTPAKTLAGDGYWSNLSVANCVNYPASANSPDGNMVEKGAQGYKLRAITPANRVVKTCGSSCSTTLANFDTSNSAISKTALGDAAMSDAARTELIDWARGLNNGGEMIGGKTAAEAAAMMRPTSHGDVVHSRPVAINYAASDAAPPQVVVYYGGNDGMLRAVNGNRDGGQTIGGKGPGEELWSFVAPESYGMFRRLKANSPKISFPTSPSGAPKSYGFDGPVTAYRDGSTAWVYATMRRGGRMLYAFDVSTPQSPTFKWRQGCPSLTDDTGCTTGFSGMGQTWAVPVLLKSAGYESGGVKQPMLIVGGGYDACEDSDAAADRNACKTSGKGRAIYLLDANTGAALQTFTTSGAVVGDVVVVKDSNGLAQYAYAADMGGNLYRISGGANTPIGTTAPGSWTMTKIASLGGSGVADRKFMFGPDVVYDNGTYVLLLGSGDREKPLNSFTNASAVQNYFFMVRDKPTDASWLTSEVANCSSAIMCLASLHGISGNTTPSQSDLNAKKGWYLTLDSTEKVVTSALTIFGNVTFSTHQPTVSTPGSCSSNLGNSRTYNIGFRDAAGTDGPRYVDLVGDGLPPSPVGGLVTLDDGTTVPFCIGCNPLSPLEADEPPAPAIASQPKSRVFWNIEQ